MKAFEPDVIIALGGGSAMDAAKIMWVMYEHPEVDFYDLAMRFMDIRKRVYTFPKMGEKAYFIAIPTSAGTGSEVTPFAVITDEQSGVKYPLADYELLPNMAIIDADFHMTAPKGLTAASGIDAVTHALEAYAAMLATDYTDGLALRALKMIFEYLPRAYDNGPNDPVAREKMANAATMAGMAFANAFLGVCHSMAHKLGAFHHLPHGVANAIILPTVMEYNAPATGEKYREIARAMGVDGVDNMTQEEYRRAAVDAVRKLSQDVGIPADLKEIVRPEDVPFLAQSAYDDACRPGNPRDTSVEELTALYQSLL